MSRPENLAGVDEVGRGPLAGAVFAAAVVLDPSHRIEGLADSKQLSEKKREKLYPLIKEQALSWCIASAGVEEIDELNILQASLLAMKRAVDGLTVPVDFVLVDGNRIPQWDYPSDSLIKGDTKNDAIKAASILAKVERDREMVRLDRLYPVYGLARHKGYPTASHLEALRVHGPSSIHRMSFAPCRAAKLARDNS